MPKRVANGLLGRDPIFGNYAITEQIKAQYNRGQRPWVYFSRNHSGHEIDLILERGPETTTVEIKSGAPPSLIFRRFVVVCDADLTARFPMRPRLR